VTHTTASPFENARYCL